MLKYKGYSDFVVYDDEARIFHGEIAGLKAFILHSAGRKEHFVIFL